MKKTFLFLIVALTSITVWGQDADDVYFVPKKVAKDKVPKETYYIGSDRDVDEYNGFSNLSSTIETLENDDVFDFDGVEGVYPDSLYLDQEWVDDYYDDNLDEDDYRYSRELSRWYGCWSPYYWGWYSPWWSPWYGSYWGWYDPWYWGWYSPWYYSSWYYPYYWGGWYRPIGIHHGWYGGIGRGWGYSNRGRGHLASGIGSGSHGVRNSRNAFNDIARRNSGSSRRGLNSSRGVSRSITSNRSNATRSGIRSYGSSRSGTSGFSSGTRGGFGGGGSRGGGFSGGGRGGGRR